MSQGMKGICELCGTEYWYDIYSGNHGCLCNYYNENGIKSINNVKWEYVKKG